MLIKFETKSNRVKGLSFHPKRPWILASLHTGSIQLWDYRMGTLIDTYDEHEGPVRGVDFHSTQPLFVSGGDDYKVKVWNYKLRRCLFTLVGHLDYIRTVEFHNEQPWIVSASDDQTIRIWNWQSRTQIAVLPGHNHYVMCASFHPKQNYIVSASLDQTVRVWDISGLKKKGAVPNGDDFMKMSQLNQDIFGSSDAMIKYILEGHERGVNWASFHPTLNLIVSGGDDKQVKLWKINETRAWEIDTFGGHLNNVSCVMFHAKKDLIISNSEDRTIRFYDLNSNKFIKNYRREGSRFWILDVHPTQNLIAAGHDNGLMVFKLERERPAYYSMKSNVLYIKDKYVRLYNFKKNSDSPVAMLRKSNTRPVRTLQYNAHENYILIVTDHEGGTYELFKLPKAGASSDVDVCAQVSKGRAIAAVFSGLKKYTILDRNKKLFVKSIDTDATREVPLKDIGAIKFIFESSPGRILIKTDQKIYQYEFEQQKIINEVAANNVKYVVWSDDYSRVALLSKHVITICTGALKVLCSVHETIRIKSGAFDENGVFIYTTLNHMKYCLVNGNSGTIKTLALPIYIVKARTNNISFVDREGEAGCITIDSTEYKFKLALAEGRTKEIRTIIGQSKILGDSIISYLQQKGYPEIAMKFVQDDVTKFNLAIECGDIDTALKSAQKLENQECWKKLGEEALKQGNMNIVEKAYQKTKNYEKLSFLYLITGNIENLKKMLKIAAWREDVNSRFHNALYLGDVEERIRIFQEVGHIGLAYVTAVTHGLTSIAENLKHSLDPNFKMPKLPENPRLMMPPIPIIKDFVWPTSHTAEVTAYESEEEPVQETQPVEEEADQWGEDIIDHEEEVARVNGEKKAAEEEAEEEIDDSQWGEGIEGVEEEDNEAAEVNIGESELLEATPDRSIAKSWPDNSQHPADHAAAGAFDSAMEILSKASGIVNFKPLKPYFLSLYAGANVVVPFSPSLPPLSLPLQRTKGNQDSLPVLANCTIDDLNRKQTEAFNATSKAQLEEAVSLFRDIMYSSLFIISENKNSEKAIAEIIRTCSEYVTALRLEIKRRSLDPSQALRGAELAAYFTRCKLQNKHLLLGLKSAMTASYKLENYVYAAGFANRLLKLNPQQNLAKQAKTVLKTKDEKPSNKFEMKYDERNPFVVCNVSMTPIYAGSDKTHCAFCGAAYLPEYKDQTCTVCDIARIGANVIGLYKYVQQFKTADIQKSTRNGWDDEE
jgi:coatomer protein complex subunit alpha (xenin)